MLRPGRTRLDPADVPPGAEGATVQDVAWLDADGNATDDEAEVVSIIVDFRTDDETPVLTVYGLPPGHGERSRRKFGNADPGEVDRRHEEDPER